MPAASSSGSSRDDDEVFDAETQRIDVPQKPKPSAKLRPKIPTLQSHHRQVPSTPEWSAVKNISATDIEVFEKTTITTKKQLQTRWIFTNSSGEEDNDDDDLLFDMVMPQPVIVKTEPNKSVVEKSVRKKELKPSENKATTKQVNDMKPKPKSNGESKNTTTTTVDLQKIVRRRCSVSLARMPMDKYVTNQVPNKQQSSSKPPPKSSKSHEKSHNVSNDKSTTSTRGTKRSMAANHSEATDAKRKAKDEPIAPSESRSRRLRDRSASTSESSSRRRGHSDDDDQSATKAKKGRENGDKAEGKKSKADNEETRPTRSTRTKSRAESVKEPTTSVCSFFQALSNLHHH